MNAVVPILERKKKRVRKRVAVCTCVWPFRLRLREHLTLRIPKEQKHVEAFAAKAVVDDSTTLCDDQ